ncbi:hypothetical protein GGS21DRAFT_374904 [Xylaria nigripes]|nr:hypothetical protein GGS21DRAFT_374904 [Xylaria nigripes]
MPTFEHLNSQAVSTLLQHKEDYIRRLQEGWKAERVRLEASRDQVEAVIEDERAMMNEERLLWTEQRVEYQKEIMDWKQRTEVAELKVAELGKLLESLRNSSMKHYPVLERTADKHESGTLGHPEIGSPSIRPQELHDGVSSISLPPGSGSTMAESEDFAPLDTQVHSLSPENIFSDPEFKQVLSISLIEDIPENDGIRPEAPAIQKSILTDETALLHASDSRKGSGKASPDNYFAMSDEPYLEPSDDDPALKGPLCLPNEPLADERFLRQLRDKLEEIKDTDATPAALGETTTLESTETGHDTDDDHTEDPDDPFEGDVPLKFRQSNNFGLPFGQLDRPHAP